MMDLILFVTVVGKHSLIIYSYVMATGDLVLHFLSLFISMQPVKWLLLNSSWSHPNIQVPDLDLLFQPTFTFSSTSEIKDTSVCELELHQVTFTYKNCIILPDEHIFINMKIVTIYSLYNDYFSCILKHISVKNWTELLKFKTNGMPNECSSCCFPSAVLHLYTPNAIISELNLYVQIQKEKQNPIFPVLNVVSSFVW